MLHAGEIPLSLFNISSLREINLDDNNLNGTLRDDMCYRLFQFKMFSLSDNHFEGVIPRSIGNCTSLQELYLQNNFFTGIPLTFLHHASSPYTCDFVYLLFLYDM